MVRLWSCALISDKVTPEERRRRNIHHHRHIWRQKSQRNSYWSSLSSMTINQTLYRLHTCGQVSYHTFSGPFSDVDAKLNVAAHSHVRMWLIYSISISSVCCGWDSPVQGLCAAICLCLRPPSYRRTGHRPWAAPSAPTQETGSQVSKTVCK